MNPRTEQRLRAAFTAKAEQVTEDRLLARRPLPDEDLGAAAVMPSGGQDPAGPDAAGELRTNPAWRAHWLAPALAAAAVARVAARAQCPPDAARRQAHAPSAGQPDQHPGGEPDSDV
ncbi:hypothetical protein [Jatrophihabitans sp.]|uniref:hypothetical protein n=1 Tax=Jatrophihabitans sp. TaxID=1932789 RepID=UPI002B675025|nr:hypothetical protein [Jatrophihabitans sp.]